MSLRSRNAFIGAAVCVALLFLTWFLAFHVGFVERADQSIYSGFGGLERGTVYSIATHVAQLCDPKPFLYLAAIPVLVALARRRVRLAVTVAVILLGANFTTQLLKPWLAQPRANSLFDGLHPVGPVSWPSGHATAAMSLALTMVLAVPGRFRPLMATLGGIFAIAVSYSFLTLGWHYPSDVFGGFLVAGTWTLACAGALLVSNARDRRAAAEEHQEQRVPIQTALAPVVASLIGALGLICVIVLVRPHEVVSYAQAHKTFLLGAAAIALFGMALATGIMLALSASDSARAPTAAPRRRWRPGSG